MKKINYIHTNNFVDWGKAIVNTFILLLVVSYFKEWSHVSIHLVSGFDTTLF